MPLVRNGWRIFYHPIFGERYEELRTEVRRLKKELPPEQFIEHRTAKLLKWVHTQITEVVPANPNARDFWLKGELKVFRRAHLPRRYRLFWVFSERHKVIIFLYLNDESTLRKAGAKTDPYDVFKQMLARGEIGKDYDANVQDWLQQHGAKVLPESHTAE
ncbi:MAG TPA: type II toxin-antitoxin system YhaV family toxin [Chloroflexota bacterium]